MNDPNQAYYGQPGYPTQQPGYPPQQGYPPQPGYPGPPPQPGFGIPGYPPQDSGMGGMGGMGGPGFMPPGGVPPYGHMPPPTAGFAPPPQPHQYGTGYPAGGDAEDPMDGDVKGFEFNDESIRKNFIKKVYSILMVQLLITLAFISLFVYHEPTKKFVRAHREIWWIALVVMFVTLIAMACCTNVRRKAPMNFIFLFLFTFAEGFMLAAAASSYQPEVVLMAVGVTAAVCLGLTLFAFQTRWDFTVMGGVLFVAVIILMVFGIVAIFVPGKTMTLVYASLGALIFSVYLIYDTQLMMGGKHKYSISPEEYIFAALNLYLDIVNIFIYILTIIGASRD